MVVAEFYFDGVIASGRELDIGQKHRWRGHSWDRNVFAKPLVGDGFGSSGRDGEQNGFPRMDFFCSRLCDDGWGDDRSVNREAC